MDPQLSNPKVVAERGEKIYQDKYKKEYERLHPGKFVAIDVTTEAAFLNDTPEGAIKLGQGQAPQGIFHLIRVGQPGAFRVSAILNGQSDWVS